jgi:Family of unknown function (DUF5681)
MSDVLAPEPHNESDATYEVGYQRPPVGTRFQKGRSGNPKGRPVGSRSLDSLLTAALDEAVTVNENGKRRSITKREAIIHQLVNKSASADMKAIQMVLALMQQVEDQPEASSNVEALDEADHKVLKQIQERVARAGGGEHA